MVGGNLRPVVRLACLCVLLFWLVDSGRADDFVVCNCMVGAMKIDWFVTCAASHVLLW